MWFRSPTRHRPIRNAPRTRPAVERLEARDVPAVSFLQGRSFLDANNNGEFDAGDTVQPGATITLTQPDNTALTAVTDANGIYTFSGLTQTGVHRLTQAPPTGFVPGSANADLWQLGGATEVQPDTITVDLSATPYNLARLGFGDTLKVVSTLVGFPNSYPGNPEPFFEITGELNVRLSGGPLAAPFDFTTYCVDLSTQLAASGTVDPRNDYPAFAGKLPGVSTAAAGQMGYLYNRYGKNGFSTAVDAAAFQVALWELTYDGPPDTTGLTNGTYRYNGLLNAAGTGIDSTSVSAVAVRNKANAFLAEAAAARPEPIVFLDGTSRGSQMTIIGGSLDFGNVPAASIGGVKFTDGNADGVQNNGDAGLANVTINLYRDNGDNSFDAVTDTFVTSTLTGAGGAYSFGGLTAGTYFVTETVPAGYVQTTTPAYYAVTLTPGDAATGKDFGNFQKARVEGTKYDDAAGDGITDGDAGLGGVTVNLYAGTSATGTPIDSTTTGPGGTYSFDGLAPGTYFVQEEVPAGSVQTAGVAGYVITVGGDDPGSLASGGTAAGKDFANFRLISLSGVKFEDKNGDGDRDPGEGGLPGWHILVNGVDSATTDADGNWTVENLGPGTYTVQEVQQAGWTQTSGTAGYSRTALSGQDETRLDFGNFQDASLTGIKYEDRNADGLTAGDAGLAGVTVNLYAGSSAGGSPLQTTTTGTGGSFSFAGLTPGTYFVQEEVPAGWVQSVGTAGYVVVVGAGVPSGGTGTGNDFANYRLAALGDFVWEDTNADGDQDAGEPGIPGVLVTLTGTTGAGAAVSKTTTTNANGLYLFDNLVPGTYRVTFPDLSGSGYTRTTADATGATDATDSDANTTTGDTGNYVLVSGQTDLTVDAGYYKPVSVGNFVWHDLNADGVQGAGEPGIGGVALTLTGTTGAGAAVSKTTTTDADGGYLFAGLPPGTYSVAVDAANFATGGALAAFTASPTLLGGDPAKDSNPSPAGTTPAALLSGGSDLTLDFGYHKLAALGDFVWHDLNANGQQDNGEPGIPNVLVTLNGTTGSGAAVSQTTTTDADGKYLFGDLVPGTYQVTFPTVTGYARTVADAGADATDSDADAGTGATGNYVLASGQTDLTVDAGYYQLAPKIDIEKKTDGSPNGNPTAPTYDNEDAPNGAGVPVLTPGTAVTWTYQVTNTGNVAFAQADVVVTDDNGTPAVTTDDLSTAPGKGITFLSVETGDSDNLLEPGEVWLYKATGVVQDLSTPGAAATFDFSGSSATSGTAGNIRTFTAGGVSVNASAFSRDTSGTWSTAFLGSYAGGLGVTDGSEGTGGNLLHTVDNVGRDNYVLFEFSERVVVDSAFLGYVGDDSDLTIWIGTIANAFADHQTLSDGLLASLGFTELNLTDSADPRTADFNAGKLAGNVLVIAARTDEECPEDRFKIETVTVNKSQPGVYGNIGSVAAPGAPGDSDPSHYTNPTPAPTGSISGKKYKDVSGNGLNTVAGTNSPADTPLAGVTVYLDLNNNKVRDTGEPSKVTNANGEYSFSGLTAGTYYVREVVPSGWVRTGPALADHYKVDLAAGASAGGKDFANYETVCTPCDFSNVSFTIAHADGTTETVTDLRGETREGDVITVTFTLDATRTVTFVSYTAPEPYFNAETASQQKIYDLDSREFGPGTYTLEVRVPNCYYQVDFVCGPAIDTLGPAGSNIFYTPQKRLLSADNGGVNCLCGGSAGTLAGYKFLDTNGNGVWNTGEPGLKNWVIYLDANGNGSKDAGELATVTDSNGYYKFNNLAAGTYRAREVQKSGWVQSAGPKGNDTLSLTAGQNRTGVNFGNYQPATVTGYKFNDKNADGYWDKNGLDNCLGTADDEVGLSGWTIFVDYDNDGVRDAGEPSAVTNANGYYSISGVRPGTWFVEEVGQSGWSKMTGDTQLVLESGGCATNVNFGNYKAGTATTGGTVTRGDTATIGFWQNKNGQKLIRSLNGANADGTNKTALGDWLASNFKKLYGSDAGTANNLAGKTNAQVAAYYSTLFKKSGMKLEAQVLATALAVYVTDSDLAGTTAAAYGFTVTTTGLGGRSYNVGSNGGAFGVANNTTRTVWQLLVATNDRAGTNGNLWNGDSTNRSRGNAVFSGINEKGDIV